MARRLRIRVPIEPPSPQAGWPAFTPAKPGVNRIALLLASPSPGQIRVICRERTDRAAWRDRPAVLPVHGDGGPRVTAAPHRPHRGSWPPLPLT